MFDINDWMLEEAPFHGVRSKITCADGFAVSVQASDYHYCTPRENYGPYTQVEVGFPSEPEAALDPYAESFESAVFAYVPVEVVNKMIDRHGGIFHEPHYFAFKALTS